jgi:hypothetical protein
MRGEPGYSLSKHDLARVNRAVQFVERLSREHVNVTPLPGFESPTTSEPVLWPVEVTSADPPSEGEVFSYPQLAGLMPAVVWLPDVTVAAGADPWRPEDCWARSIPGYALKAEDAGVAKLVGWLPETGPYGPRPVYAFVAGGAGPKGFFGRLMEGNSYGPWIIQPLTLDDDGDFVDDGDQVEPGWATAWATEGIPNPQAGDQVWVFPSAGLPGAYEFLGYPRWACGLCYDEEMDTFSVDVEQLAGERAVTGLIKIEGGGAGIGCETGSGSGSGSGSDGSGGGGCDAVGVDLECFEEYTVISDEVTGVSISGASITVSVNRKTLTFCENEAGVMHSPSVAESTESFGGSINADFLCDCCDAESPTVQASSEPGQGDCCFNFFANPGGGTPPYTFAWDFDDGHTSTDQNPTHCFEQEGTYQVTVTVTDACGKTASDEVSVECDFPDPPVQTACCENPVPASLSITFAGALASFGTVELIYGSAGVGSTSWSATIPVGCNMDPPSVGFACEEDNVWRLRIDSPGSVDCGIAAAVEVSLDCGAFTGTVDGSDPINQFTGPNCGDCGTGAWSATIAPT